MFQVSPQRFGDFEFEHRHAPARSYARTMPQQLTGLPVLELVGMLAFGLLALGF